uniref:UMOD/GP2/OIT3-like D8C domain-containing protein n=1 Tax=Scophthalmus maximus TaxID=52904 RepID=A0A8D3BXT6_SCOMX
MYRGSAKKRAQREVAPTTSRSLYEHMLFSDDNTGYDCFISFLFRKGWYRLHYKGQSIQMPERCVPVNRCGTNAPLWLQGPHPRRRDGVVTRRVCGHWKKKCCAFRSNPIKVKKCRGNFYVYKFTVPTSCSLAYCKKNIENIHMSFLFHIVILKLPYLKT